MTASRIFVTGIGTVGPLGIGRDSLAATLAKGFEPVAAPALRIEDFVTGAKTYLDPTSAMVLAATSLALRDAKLTPESASRDAVGMSFGTKFGNIATQESYLKMLREQGAKLASPLLFIHAYPNTSLSLAAIEFKLMGTSFNFNSGRAAGVEALAQAFDELRAGKMTVMLAGAGDTYTQTTRRGASAQAFDAAATLVLERELDVLKRGARGMAEVAGCGLARTADEALSRALAQASLGRPQLDWLLVDAPTDGLAVSAGLKAVDFVKAVGDCGAAGALTGVALAALVLDATTPPARLGLAESPVAAAVVSADESGAAAVVLRRIAS